MAEESEEPKVKLEMEVTPSQLKDMGLTGGTKPKSEAQKAKPHEATVAGYKPEDLLAAPFEKPKPVDTRPPNVHQKRVMVIGLIVAAAGIFFGAAFGAVVGMSLALAGAFIVAIAVMVRI